jgi:hypothetical protein
VRTCRNSANQPFWIASTYDERDTNMTRILPLLAVLLALMIFPAWGAGLTASGNWEASVMGSQVKAQVHQEGNVLQGVARVYNMFGKKDTYHFTGNIDNGRITAGHSSGHVFSGAITRDGHLVGTLRTRGGTQLAVNAVRK